LGSLGLAYVCQQTFHIMNIDKACGRVKFTGQHGSSILIIATTKPTPEFRALGKKGE